MTPTLYFLRSSEQKIVTDMLHFAYKLDEVGKSVDDFKGLDKYHKFYGLTGKDLGLYALVDNKIAGAVWIRLLEYSSTPELCITTLPEFRAKGVASAMLEQLFLEAGSIYKNISINLQDSPELVGYFKKHGFINLEGSPLMIKSISDESVVRPTDGYDPTRWMD